MKEFHFLFFHLYCFEKYERNMFFIYIKLFDRSLIKSLSCDIQKVDG